MADKEKPKLHLIQKKQNINNKILSKKLNSPSPEPPVTSSILFPAKPDFNTNPKNSKRSINQKNTKNSKNLSKLKNTEQITANNNIKKDLPNSQNFLKEKFDPMLNPCRDIHAIYEKVDSIDQGVYGSVCF